MIVLHEQKLIVLKARKVGGTSFEIALSKFASEKSIITPIRATDEQIRISLGFRGPQNYHYSTQELLLDNHNQKIPLKFFNHITASLAKERLGNEIWDSYKKVAIIRNPFDRMISS
jgi:hypothetical protein